MRRSLFFALVVALFFTASQTLQAQEKGTWHPASKTAASITSDLSFGRDVLSINFINFQFFRARDLTAQELAAVFNLAPDGEGSGGLYRLNIPGDKRFLHRNTLCASADVTWMVTDVSGQSLQVAFFSGDRPPVFNRDAIASSTELCGTFAYAR